MEVLICLLPHGHPAWSFQWTRRSRSGSNLLREFLTVAHQKLGLEFGIELWDGVRIPQDYPADGLAVAIADEGAVAALLRKPKPETMANLWASARVDIRNGTIFDLVGKRPKVRTKNFIKSLDKMHIAKLATKFLFVPRGGPWPLETVSSDKQSDGSAKENKKNISYHYRTCSNAFYELWLDKEMVYTCSYFTDWNNSIDQSQFDKLDMVCKKLRLKARRNPARHGLRLGRALDPRGQTLRREGLWRDPVGTTGRLCQ